MTRLPGSGDGARLLVSDARPSCLVRRRLAPLARRCRVGGAGVWALIPGGSKGTNNLRVLTIAFSPDGRTLATSGADGSIYLWDVATGHLVATHTDPGAGGIYSVAFSPDGRILAAAGTNGSIYLWHVG